MDHVPRPPLPAIPEPSLRRLGNLTPFVEFQFDKMGPGRRFFDTVAVKGTFDLAPDRLVQSAKQEALTLVDEVWDPERAERSSLKRAGEVLLFKPGTDLYLTGSARTADGQARPWWDVAVGLHSSRGPVLSHALRVHGQRFWRHQALRGWTLTDSQPSAAVPLRYELAFGGAHLDHAASTPEALRWKVHAPNPSGMGLVDTDAVDRGRPLPAPQWELAGEPLGAIGRPVAVAGLGPVARPWASRLGFAGTYDEAWLSDARRAHQEGRPLDYATDFDYRFFQCAPPQLRAPTHVRGDELLGLSGLVAGHERLLTRLPGIEVCASLYTGSKPWLEETLPLDTVHVDLDAMKVFLIWRLVLDQTRGVKAAVILQRKLS